MGLKRGLKRVLNVFFYNREKGLKKELKFWNSWIEQEGLEWKEDYKFRMNPESQILPELRKYCKQIKNNKIRILDVGAGPITRIGYKFDGKELEIKACDPLADQYNELLEKHQIVPTVKTENVEGEKLTKFYDKGSFDICTAFNCLDHSDNPLEIIKQMVDLCNKDGVVYLRHFENEASVENYKGLHRWNFYLNDADLLEINSLSKKHLLHEMLPQSEVVNHRIDGEIITEIRSLDRKNN